MSNRDTMASAILINLAVYEGTIGQSCVMPSPTVSSLICNPNDSIQAVKEKLALLEVFDEKKQKCTLIFEGRVMEKNAWPIERYGIAKEGDMIQVILRRTKVEADDSELLKLTKVVRFVTTVVRAGVRFWTNSGHFGFNEFYRVLVKGNGFWEEL
ncbi:hypothetical protein Tco_0357523 [Tanacetum coccineum]